MDIITKNVKTDIKILNETLTLPIDSAKFLTAEALTNGWAIYISDRYSLHNGNENPKANIRWVHYPRLDKMQLCIAVDGAFHVEPISYAKSNPNNWERLWIYIDVYAVPLILNFLERNPLKLASWM